MNPYTLKVRKPNGLTLCLSVSSVEEGQRLALKHEGCVYSITSRDVVLYEVSYSLKNLRGIV